MTYDSNYPNFYQAIKLIGLYVLIVTFTHITGSRLFSDSALASLITYVTSFTAIIIVGYKRKMVIEGPQARNNIKILNFSTTILIVIAIISMQFFLDPIYSILPKTWLDEIADREFGKIIQPNIVSALSIVIAPAILEELFFRGVILDGFLKIYEEKKAIFLSALLFGLIHMNIQQFFAGLTIGLLIGWVYSKTRILWYCVIVHALNNLFNYIYYLKFEKTVLADALGSQLYLISICVSLCVFIFSVFHLNKRFNQDMIEEYS